MMVLVSVSFSRCVNIVGRGQVLVLVLVLNLLVLVLVLVLKAVVLVLVLKGLVIGLDNNTGYHELTQSLREFTRLI